jgi:hypothetical protein
MPSFCVTHGTLEIEYGLHRHGGADVQIHRWVALKWNDLSGFERIGWQGSRVRDRVEQESAAVIMHHRDYPGGSLHRAGEIPSPARSARFGLDVIAASLQDYYDRMSNGRADTLREALAAHPAEEAEHELLAEAGALPVER